MPAGSRRRIPLPAGRLPTGTEITMPVHVVHGSERGPVVWLSGAIHGDEVVGVEIIRQVLERIDASSLRGTILAVPVVNVFGFVTESRYLPDRRDLNRSFPGSPRGSLAARLAHRFITEVVDPADLGLDFHAGSDDRTNLPQIRGNLEDPETRRLAIAFAPPLAIHSKTISGCLREAAGKRGKVILLFEGGEPKRFDSEAVGTGVDGTLRVLSLLGMIEEAPRAASPPALSSSTRWTRATRGGLFRLEVGLGARVDVGDPLGFIADPAGDHGLQVRSRTAGIVMGYAVSPFVHQGDALVHVAEIAPD